MTPEHSEDTEHAADLPGPPTDGVLRMRTPEVDLARAWIAETLLYPVHLEPLGDPEHFDFAMSGLRLGPVTFSTLTYHAHVRSRCDSLGVAYHLNLPTAGRIVQSHRGETHACTADEGRVPVFEPTGPLAGELDAEAAVLALGFDRQAVESALEEHLEHSVRPLHFPGGFDPHSGHGRALGALARVLRDELAAPSGLLRRPAVAAQFAETLLTTMLHATPHQYAEELVRPTPRTRPRPVKRAVDAMHADPAHPFTVRELARLAGVSARSLQAGFKQHLDTSPMAYLRRLRLERAHLDLTAPGPPLSVTEVAGRWGFTHLGRFAAVYRARYGTLPSHARRP